MKSYRRERIKDLNDGMHIRHAAAGRLVVDQVKQRTPVGTPASTGDPEYVSKGLVASISSDSHPDHVDIGTNKPYAPYVHQGTYDFAHGYRGWTDAEAREAEAHFRHNRREQSGVKGAMPRPFLVTGLIASKPFLYAIYNKPIKSR